MISPLPTATFFYNCILCVNQHTDIIILCVSNVQYILCLLFYSNRYVSALKVLEDYPDTVPLLRSLTQLIKTSLKDGYNAEDIEKVKGAMDHLNFTKSSQCEIVFNLCLETGQIEGAWQEMQVLI